MSFTTKLRYKISSLQDRKEVVLDKFDIGYIALNFIYVAWLILGVCYGSDKIPFALLISLVVFDMKKKPLGMIVDSLLSYFILFIIILNKFCLHIDFLAYFREYILIHLK